MTDHPDFSAMSKDELIEFADVRGIEFDKRWGAAKLVAAIEDALTDPKAKIERTTEEERAEWGRILDESPIVALQSEPQAGMEPAPEPTPKAEKPASARARPSNLSREEVYEACIAWASEWCRDIEHVDIDQTGDVLTIAIITKHGEGHGAVEGFEPTEAGLSEALALIRKQIG